MTKVITRFVFTILALIFSFSTSLSQSGLFIIDSFSDHTLKGWYSGGNITMKYSHTTDNLENGYSELFSNTQVTPNSFIGLIRKEQNFPLTQDNILSVMLQGISADINATIQVIFDSNNDGKYDESIDSRLESNPISLNFSGWKEIHLNINQDEFKIFSKTQGEDFSILENEAFGIQIIFQSGKNFTTSKIETGIALIAERPNKEMKQEIAKTEDDNESYFSLRNYPNPFNPITTIRYTLKSAGNVKLTVYDRLGREIVLLFEGQQSEGEHSIEFNASTLPSGIYFYRLKTSEKTEVKKMVLAK